jgi:uncharacterized membrane protein YccC
MHSSATASDMTTTTIERPLHIVGVPAGSLAFGIRIWLAVVVALAAGFWLELEVPSTAAVTVAILAEPTRGRALEKALFRLIATVIGVTAAIVIVALFSQTRDLLLAAFAGWIGLCVYAAGLLDGNRAYAAVLSGYSVGLIAIQQIDAPNQVFQSGMERGAAIAVGIAAIALVNDLLAAPNNYPLLASRLAALHLRIGDYAKALLRDAAADPTAAAGLLGDIAALRPEIASLVMESASGSIRSAAARSAAVALVAQVHAVRVLSAIVASTAPNLRTGIVAALDRQEAATADLPTAPSTPAHWALREVLRRDDEVRDGLAALRSGTPARLRWRTPLYRSQPTAAVAGIRAALCVALASVFFVLAGWPSASSALLLVTIILGLGATTPNPQAFTINALIAAPIAAVLAGSLEFLILDGVTEFPLLALALAPFMIGAVLAVRWPHPIVAALGRLNLIFILDILSPSNPQPYDPNAFLFSVLFLVAGVGVLLAGQLLIPPPSGETRLRWLLASARRELDHVLSGWDRRWAPEETMFRDAMCIAQLAGAARGSQRQRAVLTEALSCFDQAGAIRLSRARLARPAGDPGPQIVATAKAALSARDPQGICDAARALASSGATEDGGLRAARDALVGAAIVIDAARRAAEPAMEQAA